MDFIYKPLLNIKVILKNALAAASGIAITLLMGLYWLISNGVFNNFMDMVLNYLPHYSTINGRNFARQPIDSWVGAGKWLFSQSMIFVIPLVLSLYFIFRYRLLASTNKRFVFLLLALWLLYLSYVPMAGKYWGYHVLPSAYFLAMCLSLVAVSVSEKTIPRGVFFSVLGVWALLIWLIVFQQAFWISPKSDAAYNERSQLASRELADFLKQHLQPGDKVQSHVAHTHGSIFPALLMAEAIPATPYLENYLLYHDIDQPFVIHARHQFLSTLQASPPRFIVATPTVFFFHGEHTDKIFQPFEDWLAKHYIPVFTASDQPDQRVSEIFTVYEYQDLSTVADPLAK